jgi:glycolate oxidase FAD binding subunit
LFAFLAKRLPACESDEAALFSTLIAARQHSIDSLDCLQTMSLLPLTETITPANEQELTECVREANATRRTLYPIGGGTSLQFGLPAKTPGTGLSLVALNQVIDYPARDMTITVEAGITMAALASVLAQERQQLPLDVPQAKGATLGGVVATNWNGPRRYGCGSVRDAVIGIRAVDGQGMPFQGGGRVVKNVAGYDFCKLLTGSCGTLGIITQLTLKVHPIPAASKLLTIALNDYDHAQAWLELVARSAITPVAVEWLSGPSWKNSFPHSHPPASHGVLRLEGTEPEVAWMVEQHRTECASLGWHVSMMENSDEIWSQIIEWPCGSQSPLVLQAHLPPSGVVDFVSLMRSMDAECDVLAHAGSGVVMVKCSRMPSEGLSRMLVGQLQPAVAKRGGRITVLENPSGQEATRQSYWGGVDSAVALLQTLKSKFDPAGILNPGRFVV